MHGDITVYRFFTYLMKMEATSENMFYSLYRGRIFYPGFNEVAYIYITFALSVFSLYLLYSTRSFNQNKVDYCNLTLS